MRKPDLPGTPTLARRAHAPLVGLILDAAGGFGRAIFRGVMRYARVQAGWRFFDGNPAAGPQEHWPRCDALIIAAGTPQLVRFAQAQQIAVNVSGRLADPGLPSVLYDDRAVGRTGAEHLLERGFRHLAFHGYPDLAMVRERVAGFVEAIAQRGREARLFDWPRARDGAVDLSRYWPRLQQWLAALPKPIGVMNGTDTEARLLAQCCWELDIPVPEQVAIVGVDNDELVCHTAAPPLSSVEPRGQLVGYEAARLIDRMMAGHAPPGEPLRIAPGEVVVRQSSDILAIDVPQVARALRFIREHACDPCTVDDVLDHVMVSRRWLELRFRELLGRSPHEEITRIRIERARLLLTETRLPLAQVALRSGFAHVQNLTRAFRPRVGDTPAAYRRRHADAI